MEERYNLEQQMIRYLLGELSIKDKLEMEMEYFTDPELFDLLLAIEQDLIEGYVNGKLSPSGRIRFEHNYLTAPVRLEQVRFFQTLTTVLPLKSTEPAQEPIQAAVYDTSELVKKTTIWELFLAPFRVPRLAFGISMAAALLILAVVGAMKIYETRGLDEPALTQNDTQPSPDKKEVPEKVIEDAQAPTTQSTPVISIVQQTPAPKAPVIASFVWTVPGIRSLGNNAPRVIRIPHGNETVQLTLNFPDLSVDRYSKFSAALQNSAGKEVWRRSDIKASRVKSGSFLLLKVPANKFQNGPYSLMLRGNNRRGEWVDIRKFFIEVEK